MPAYLPGWIQLEGWIKRSNVNWARYFAPTGTPSFATSVSAYLSVWLSAKIFTTCHSKNEFYFSNSLLF